MSGKQENEVTKQQIQELVTSQIRNDILDIETARTSAIMKETYFATAKMISMVYNYKF